MKPEKTRVLDLLSRKRADTANLGLRLPRALLTGAVLVAMLAVMACSSAEKPAGGANVAPGSSGSPVATQPQTADTENAAAGSGAKIPSQAVNANGSPLKDPDAQAQTQPVSPSPGGEASGETQVIYTSMLEAYARGQLGEARRLARGFLEEFSSAMRVAADDSQREALVTNALGVIISMTAAENRLAAPARLGGDVEFLNFVKSVIIQSSDLTEIDLIAPEAVKEFLRDETGRAAAGWLAAAAALVSQEELEQFYQQFESEVQGVGYQGLGAVTAALLAADQHIQYVGLRVTGDEAAQIRQAIGDYFNGLVNGDLALLQSATGLDTTAVGELLEAFQLDIQEEGASGIRGITPPTLPTDLLLHHLAEDGTYSMLVEEISLELAMPDDSVVSTTIDKNFRFRQEDGGQWIILVPLQ